jgi:coenzyme F420-0:L-glutamate ligase / coenzyme F420-1:gamma-L-glutamate ligase
MRPAELSTEERAFVASARAATLATIAPDGMPRLVPVCFVLAPDRPDRLYTPIDDKPKVGYDPRALARIRDISADPAVALLVERWSEDWSELGWVRLAGAAEIVEPAAEPGEHAAALAALRDKYPQYATHRLEERPVIRIDVTGSRSWGSLAISD